jgi:rhodanese-related sulfurtransferase
MTFKRLTTLLILVGIMLTGVLPVLAQGDGALASAVTEFVPTIAPPFGVLQAADLNIELLENPPFLVDVRNPDEWAENGYIEGAVLVPVKEIAQHLDLLPADLDTPIVVYCAKGTRGLFGMTALHLLGYTDVRNLAGGFGAWVDAGLPVATDDVEFETAGPADIDPALVEAMDAYLNSDYTAGWAQVSVEDVNTLLLENPDVFLLDVRSDAELETDGYIDGSTHIVINEIVDNLDQIPADQEIIVYCKSGWRGTIATIALQGLGYDARNMRGGIMGWIAGEYPVMGGSGSDVATFSVDTMVAGFVANLPQGWGVLSVDNLSVELLENPPFLVDVRNPDELAENGYIEGMVNIPVKEIAQHLDLLPADLDTPIVVYCAKGTRGIFGMSMLQMMGYTDVRNLAGGFGAWAEAGQPVATEAVEPEVVGPPDLDPALVEAIDTYMNSDYTAGWAQISIEDTNTALLENPDLFLLDVREPAELEELGYLEGAVHIPMRELTLNLDQIPADQEIIVYCKSGWRGSIATIALQVLGYDAHNMSGGITGWIAAEYPVVGVEVEAMAAEPVEIVVELPEGTPLDAEVVAPVAFESVQMVASMAGFGTAAEADFAAMMDGAFILDVREPAEYAEGFIPGAVNIPLRDLADSTALLPDFDDPILIYCAAGYRGAVAQLGLDILGYNNTVNLRGGFQRLDR